MKKKLEKYKFIPYGKQTISSSDIDQVIKTLKSDFLTQGPVIPLFQKALSKYTGSKYSVLTNSCSSALHIACLALGLKEGDIVWTSPISYVASANCAKYCGASVDFVDISPESGLMNIQHLEQKLIDAEINNKLPKIVIPVHFAGQSCNMKKIHKLSLKYKFKIIEDAAHAIGALYENIKVGACQYSDICVFSFHPVKNITTGEGGCALTNNIDLYEKLALYSSHGVTKDDSKYTEKREPWEYEQLLLGYNFRLTDFQAALGMSQLKKCDSFISKRRALVNEYCRILNREKLSPLKEHKYGKSAYHLFVIRLNSKDDRDNLFHFLKKNGIQTNVHYMPIYKQPYHKQNIYLEGAEKYYSSAISLPLFPLLNFNDIATISKKVNTFIQDNASH